MKFLGKVSNFDPLKYRFTVDLMFVDESSMPDIEKLLEADALTFTVKQTHKSNEELLDPQRKMWFLYISLVLKHNEVQITQESKDALDEAWRRSYLPCGWVNIGQDKICVPPSLARGASNAPTDEQMALALKKIRLDYEEMGVRFEQ